MVGNEIIAEAGMRHVAKQESRTQKRSARQRKTQTGILLKYTPIPPHLNAGNVSV